MKYLCYFLLFWLDLLTTVWYPISRTLHHYLITQRSKDELSRTILANLKYQWESQILHNNVLGMQAERPLINGFGLNINGGPINNGTANHQNKVLEKEANEKALDMKSKSTEALK